MTKILFVVLCWQTELFCARNTFSVFRLGEIFPGSKVIKIGKLLPDEQANIHSKEGALCSLFGLASFPLHSIGVKSRCGHSPISSSTDSPISHFTLPTDSTISTHLTLLPFNQSTYLCAKFQ